MKKNRAAIIIITLFLPLSIFAQTQTVRKDKENRVIYKYKKHQKFDFEDIVIEGETGNPGDLSVSPRFQRRFKNKLPYRENFNAEIRKGVERIR